MPKDLLQMHLKLIPKDQFKQKQKQLVIFIGSQIADKSVKRFTREQSRDSSKGNRK